MNPARRYPRPGALPAPIPPRLVLDASAGTGKTFTLEHLVVDLLLGGLRIEQILVVTYTEKAAGEMRDRIRRLIGRLRMGDFQDAGPDEPAWVLDDAARQALDRARLDFDRASISTIHGFCQRLLQETAFLSGQAFGAELVDGVRLFRRAVQECLRRRWAVRDSGVSGELAAALEASGGEEGLAQVLAEVRQEAGRRWPETPGPAGPAAQACAALARFDPGRLGLDPASLNPLRKNLDALQTACKAGDWDAAGTVLGRLLSGETKGSERLLALPGDALPDLLFDLQEALSTPESRAVDRFLPDALDRLAELKEREGLLDYDDMIRRVAGALRDSVSGPLLEAQLRTRYQAALIDEFQDTDPVQWGIFERVFGRDGRLVLIGDPKQAIYGFRGTDVHTYLRAKQAMVDRGAPVAALDRNFRSTPAMVQAYNAILDQGAPAPFFTGDGIRYDVPVAAGRTGLRWVDAQGRDLAPVRLVRVPLEGERRLPQVKRAVARGLALEVRALLERGPVLRDGSGQEARPLAPEEIFVLTRSGPEAALMAEELRRAGVPAAFYKQDGVFQSPEALDLLNVLRAVAAPYDPDRRAKAWLTPVFGAGLADLARSLDLPEAHPFMESLLAWHDLARRGDYPALFRSIVDGGLLRRLLRLHRDDRAAGVWLQLTEFMLEQCCVRHGGFQEAVDFLADCVEGRASLPGEDAAVHRAQTDRSAVQILTMHKSKGLEARAVVLFGGFTRWRADCIHRFVHDGGRRFWLGRKPSARLAPRVDRETREEDQRLLYVALTRAQAQLILPVYHTGGGVACVGFDRATADPQGAYGAVNHRLRALLPEAGKGLFEAVDLPLGGPDPVPVLAEPGPAPALPAPFDPARLADLARAAEPPRFDSFTSLTRELREHAPADPEDRAPADLHLAPPGGTATGTCLHAVLEQVPPASALEAGARDPWMARPDVARILDTAMAEAGLDPRYRTDLAQLAFQALAGPYRLPGGGTLPGLGALSRIQREMDFLMPRPGRIHLLEGGIDLLFEWEGRTCFLDWKSNGLPDYGPEACAEVLRTHYALQFAIYTLAACAFLGVQDEAEYEARFGGGLYVFVRGLPEAGQVALRPPWAQVQAWRRALRSDQEEEIHVDL
ncbi:MAG: UvrD-helicase domain-containing protein [Holophaga sp.]